MYLCNDQLNWTKYIEEMFADTEDMTLNLNDANNFEIAIEDISSFNKTIRHIYKMKMPSLLGESNYRLFFHKIVIIKREFNFSICKNRAQRRKFGGVWCLLFYLIQTGICLTRKVKLPIFKAFQLGIEDCLFISIKYYQVNTINHFKFNFAESNVVLR